MIPKIGIETQNSRYVRAIKAVPNTTFPEKIYANKNVPAFCGKEHGLKSLSVKMLQKIKSKIPHNIIIISGPSGVGKSSIINELNKINPDLRNALSYMTRAPRSGETHGIDAFFISPETYNKMLKNGEFLQTYSPKGDLYGTSKNELNKHKGADVLLNISSNTIQPIKNKYKKRVILIFIKAPDADTVKERLIKRATETPLQIEERLQRGQNELRNINSYDKVIVNDDLYTATNEVKEYIESRKNLVVKVIDSMITCLKK